MNTIPFGIGVAASARVGNLIGARDAEAAKCASHTAALLSVVVGAVVMTALMATKDVRGLAHILRSSLRLCFNWQTFGYLYSDDAEVVELVSQVMPLVASFQVCTELSMLFPTIHLSTQLDRRRLSRLLRRRSSRTR